MLFSELPKKWQRVAVKHVVDEWNTLYSHERLYKATKDSPEVKERLDDLEFEIEIGKYSDGSFYENLIMRSRY